MDYEQNGFFNSVVFTCGLIIKDKKVKIYYGAADKYIALVEIELDKLYKALNIT